MGDAHGGIGAVDVLPARAGSAVGVDAQVVGIDLHFHVLGLGQHCHGRRGGVDAPGALRHGHALHAMHAALKFELFKHVLAGDEGHALLDAAQLRGAVLDQFPLPALPVGIVLVHAQKLGPEQPRLVAARAGAHFQHGVLAVVRVLGQHGDARRVQCLAQFRLQLVHFLARHLRHVGVVQKLVRLVELLRQRAAVFGNLVELGKVAVLAHQFGEQLRIGDDFRQRDADGQFLVARLDALQLRQHARLFSMISFHYSSFTPVSR